MTTEDEAERTWVEARFPLVRDAFDFFVKSRGSWPLQETLQRQAAQRADLTRVADLLWGAPRLAFETSPPPQTVSLPVRVLRYLPEAEPVLCVVLAMVRSVVAAYFRPGGEATVYHLEPSVVDASEDDLALALLASALLREERMGVWVAAPSVPTGTGSMRRASSWTTEMWRRSTTMRRCRSGCSTNGNERR